MKERMKLPFMF